MAPIGTWGGNHDLVRALNAQGARYLVVGAVATIYYVPDRPTEHRGELDLLIERSVPNAEKVLSALQSIGYFHPDYTVERLTGPRWVRLAIHRAVRESGLPATALIEGVCESSATIVALACDRVLARPHATLFFHELTSNSPGGNAVELEAKASTCRAAREQFVAIYCERTGLPRREAGALMATETRLDAYEAQRLGFVHHVLGYGETDPDEESAARVGALVAEVAELLQRSREELP
jgi:ATP-dependent protease ClpP protease subunit